jgi:hypothetical protein
MNPGHSDPQDEIQPEYDFRTGVRGKYAARFEQGSNVVVLDPDVTEVFATPDDVNAALRALIGIIRRQTEQTPS